MCRRRMLSVQLKLLYIYRYSIAPRGLGDVRITDWPARRSPNRYLTLSRPCLQPSRLHLYVQPSLLHHTA